MNMNTNIEERYDRYSTHRNRIIKRYALSMLTNLNSENILLYSNNGKNLYIHIHRASHTDHCFFWSTDSIYLIIPHSNIGDMSMYIIKNIAPPIITSSA